MRKRVVKILVVVLLLNVGACAPRTKERYMEQYAKFMIKLSNSYSSYSDDEWIKTEETFNKFKGKYYEKFKDELTTSDKIKLASYEVKFVYYKSLDTAKDYIETGIEKLNIEENVKAVKDYVENDLEDDLNELQREGDSTLNNLNKLNSEVERVIEEISSQLQL